MAQLRSRSVQLDVGSLGRWQARLRPGVRVREVGSSIPRFLLLVSD